MLFRNYLNFNYLHFLNTEQDCDTKTKNRIKNITGITSDRTFVLPDSKSPIPDQGYLWKDSENLPIFISAAAYVSVCMSRCLFAPDSMTLAQLWGFEKQKRHPIPRTGFYRTKRKEAGHQMFLTTQTLALCIPISCCAFLYLLYSLLSLFLISYIYTLPHSHCYTMSWYIKV